MAERLNTRELLDIVAKLSLARNVQQIADVVRTSARRLSGADGVTFVLRDGGYCFYADEDAIGPLWKGRRFPMEQCISGWVMLNRRSASIPDIYQDPRIPHDAYRPTFVKSLIMVPIRREDPVGAIGAYWAEVAKPGETELEVLQALADAGALAFANVQLYTELESTVASDRAARAAAEEASRLKDEFLATLSHELRTPLHVIRGWLWQLRQPGATEDMRRRGLEVIERNATQQAKLVEDLLDTSRAMSGKLRLDLRLVDLAHVCRAVAETAAPAAEARRITVNVSFEEGAAVVKGDPDRLQQIVWNLVSNAITFGVPGGSVEIAGRREADAVRLEVRDDGIGIDPDFLPHIFDPFRQAEAGTTRRFGGLGLGLAIVRQLMTLHGGTATARSAGPGNGTTVILDFPLATAIAAPAGVSLAAPGGVAGCRLDGLRVFLLDDEPEACETERRILEEHGAIVETAATARDALDRLVDEVPDLLLTDLSMSGADGFAFVRSLRGLDSPARHVPAAALLRHPDEKNQREAEAAGFQACLSKPVHVAQLTDTLARLAGVSGSAMG